MQEDAFPFFPHFFIAMGLLWFVICGFAWNVVHLFLFFDGAYGIKKKQMSPIFASVVDLISNDRESWQHMGGRTLAHSRTGISIDYNNDYLTIEVPSAGRFRERTPKLRGGKELVEACELVRGILALKRIEAN